MVSRSSLVVATLFAVVGIGGQAWSQTPPPPDTSAPPPPEAGAPPAAVPAAPPPPPMEAAPPMAPPPAPPPAAGPPSFKIDVGGGNTLRIGLLLQPQFQALGSTELNGTSYNLYLRRTRILVGGTLFDGMFEYFLDTDYPNLFLATNEAPSATAAATTTKATPGMNIQDAFATWKPLAGQYKDWFKIDAGYMLPPMAHNAVQGATTLYMWDYFSFTFLSTANTLLGSSASPVGRDLGVEARGLLFGGLLEYRLGLFQGLRSTEQPAAMGDTATTVGSNNFFRAVGRLQLNLLDPEPGFFYAGTYLGKKKVLSIGAAFDTQKSYHYFAGDVFADMPLGPGVFTAQVNLAHWDGGTFVAIAKETALMGEIGYNIFTQVAPILHLEYLWGGTSSGGVTSVDQGRFGGGLAFWPFGHNSNLKAFYTRNTTKAAGQHGDNQFNVQWQLYFF
jgi:hypothetical protein